MTKANMKMIFAEYVSAQWAMKEAERDLKKLKDEIIEYMERYNKDELTADEYTAKLTRSSSFIVNSDRLREEYPQIAEELKKEVVKTRLTVK